MSNGASADDTAWTLKCYLDRAVKASPGMSTDGELDAMIELAAATARAGAIFARYVTWTIFTACNGTTSRRVVRDTLEGGLDILSLAEPPGGEPAR